MSDDSAIEMELVPTSESEVPVEAKKRIHEDEDENCSPDDAKRQKTEGVNRSGSPCSPTPVPTPKSTTSAPSPSGSATKNSITPTSSSNSLSIAPPATSLYTPPATATVFSKSSWLDKMPALHLNDAQKAALDKAKAFAKEMQSVLLNSAGSNHSPPPLPTLLLSSNPGLASGIDPRSLSVLSRIYVGSINFELTEQHLRVVFGQFGAIKSVSMSLDTLTGKHKGFCFIEFETPEGASLALDSMNGAELGGRQLKVGRPNNYTAATAAGLSPPPKTRIYVSNVNEYVSEEDLLSIFESFGKINHCALMPDLITRKHKGYGLFSRQFIEFEDESSASTAVTSMNNFELGGLILHVGKAVIGGPLSEGMKAIEKLPPLPAGATPPPPIVTSPSVSAAAAAAKAQNAAAKIAADLAARGQTAVESVAQEENMSISASQRYAIMQKLARQESSPVVVIKNAVAPSEVDDTLEDEFKEECSNYGNVERVVVYVDSEEIFESERGLVKIFVEFDDENAAEKAKEKLDGRWFGGRRINASLFDLKKFQTGDYSN
ncbi:poly(U)-binding-splicing factor PUF60-like isoform X2 [Rhizophagus irregularis DAOM 181602=DAOM 197198]|nr:poly(U)-binding-splicing factor PUF60-like isoform X2 [Rhizophagus irregularis DAOM 181602=DAOM 197198]